MDCACKYQHSCRSCFSWTVNKRQQKLHRVVYGRPRKANLVLANKIKSQTHEYWRVRLSKELIRRRLKRPTQESNLPVQCSDASSVCYNEVERVVSLPSVAPLASAVMVCPPINVKSLRLEDRFQPGLLLPPQEEDCFVCSAIECTEKEVCSNLTRLVCGLVGCKTYYSDPPCSCSDM